MQYLSSIRSSENYFGIIFASFSQIVICSIITGCSPNPRDTVRECANTNAKSIITKDKEQKAVLKEYQTGENKEKEIEFATLIQTHTKGHLARQNFSKKKQNITKIQAAVRGHQAREIKSKEKLRPSAAAVTTQVLREEGSHQKTSAMITLDASMKLSSTVMRGFVGSQFMINLGGFKQSKRVFSSGGVEKAMFFFRRDSDSGEKTYIAFANDYDYQEIAPCIKYIQSGEQSISIVLSMIKSHFEKGYRDSNSTQILIPLQQLDKGHWTLLEIVLEPDSKTRNSIRAIAKCYDPKSWSSNSNFIDFWINPKRIDYVKQYINRQFGADTEWIREGRQGIIDHHNCGRYTLIKMGELLRIRNAPKSIKEVNDVLAPKISSNDQLVDHPKAYSPASSTKSISEDWEGQNGFEGY